MGCHTWEYHNPTPVELPSIDEVAFARYCQSWYDDMDELNQAMMQLKSWFGRDVSAQEMLRWSWLDEVIAGADLTLLSADCTERYVECDTIDARFRVPAYPYFILFNPEQAFMELRNYCVGGLELKWFNPKQEPKQGLSWVNPDDYVYLSDKSTDKQWYEFERHLQSLWVKEPTLVLTFG